jgi:uncharacterized protein YndB with AHSA1/START domain
MATVTAAAEHTIDAPADVVYGYLADMHQHPRFLPQAFSHYQVVEGGVGAGTVTQFKVTAGGRTREYRTRITEPEPGKTLVETDTRSSLVTTFSVLPQDGKSLVRISSSWDGAGGIGGFFERTFAPRMLRKIFLDELDRLNAYARHQRVS